MRLERHDLADGTISLQEFRNNAHTCDKAFEYAGNVYCLIGKTEACTVNICHSSHEVVAFNLKSRTIRGLKLTERVKVLAVRVQTFKDNCPEQ